MTDPYASWSADGQREVAAAGPYASWGADGRAEVAAATPSTTNNDFRRQEIVDMNAGAVADSRKMTMWGLIGLAVVAVLFLSTNRSKRS